MSFGIMINLLFLAGFFLLKPLADPDQYIWEFFLQFSKSPPSVADFSLFLQGELGKGLPQRGVIKYWVVAETSLSNRITGNDSLAFALKDEDRS